MLVIKCKNVRFDISLKNMIGSGNVIIKIVIKKKKKKKKKKRKRKERRNQ
jgi:hypothetical protein